MPTEDEDARINQGIASDPDNPELTEADFRAAQPAQSALPVLASARRVRGPQKAPTKMLVSMRLDEDVLAAWRATGPGWQTRVNEELRRALERR
ncbi:BrnA antitoxin family protein [Acetobacter sp. TBRC 12305]|uniref:BrnA antitoxin family protein n=2 Tax=Acetobacter garciniae TaxID=2817435 RepID=A0A939KMH1_9PROT|nr:BrnA antitoxin family protein [Acetobacter garciniae]MBO1325328.1 BrnA antitoxin family protein [Acetobacter garciniae]MBX0345500.1 BrnA antitoxin family protein [Acetobacter garciniae]